MTKENVISILSTIIFCGIIAASAFYFLIFTPAINGLQKEKMNLKITNDSLILKLSEIPKNSITIKEETVIGKIKKGGSLNKDTDNKAKIEDKSKINK